MATKADDIFSLLCEHVRKTAYLESTSALLEWDQQTKLPNQGNAYRSEQVTFLAGEIHRRRTDPCLKEWLGELAESKFAEDSKSREGAIIKNLKRDFDKKSKIPTELVEALAKAASQGHQTWVEARKNNDFKSFEPILTETVRLKKEMCDAIGYEDCRYNVLLDDYEPGAKTSEVAQVLTGLRDELVPLVDAIVGSERKVSTDVLHRLYPVDVQREFGVEASSKIGFDYERGRLDVTHHPFCTELGPDDCRITTRYDENFFNSAFFGTLHEAGHGIYEQGLPGEEYGLPTGKYCSLGIHESQSRLWENLVGRSRPFWDYFYPKAQARFGAALNDVSVEDFYNAINAVEPSLIRVEADQATYDLHIIIRFELERELIDGDLHAADLPTAWNEKYQQALGVQSETDSDGVLQDVHWSAGLFGYFATYSLGNLYASQLFEAAESELGNLGEMFSTGQFVPLKNWLNEKVHSQGKRFSSPELGERITGKPLSHDALIRHLRSKLDPIYRL